MIPSIPATGPWLAQATTVIQKGGVVALAFERLFGLAADALNLDAVRRSAAIKDRPLEEAGDKPISVILPDIAALAQVALPLSEAGVRIANANWPGPATLVVPARSGLPAPLVSRDGFIGLRVPGPCPAFALAQASCRILTATSANRKGAKEPLHWRALADLDGVDLIVEGTVDGPPGSTVAKIDGSGVHILRQGIVPLKGI